MTKNSWIIRNQNQRQREGDVIFNLPQQLIAGESKERTGNRNDLDLAVIFDNLKHQHQTVGESQRIGDPMTCALRYEWPLQHASLNSISASWYGIHSLSFTTQILKIIMISYFEFRAAPFVCVWYTINISFNFFFI